MKLIMKLLVGFGLAFIFILGTPAFAGYKVSVRIININCDSSYNRFSYGNISHTKYVVVPPGEPKTIWLDPDYWGFSVSVCPKRNSWFGCGVINPEAHGAYELKFIQPEPDMNCFDTVW